MRRQPRPKFTSTGTCSLRCAAGHTRLGPARGPGPGLRKELGWDQGIGSGTGIVLSAPAAPLHAPGSRGKGEVNTPCGSSCLTSSVHEISTHVAYAHCGLSQTCATAPNTRAANAIHAHDMRARGVLLRAG